MKYNLQFFAGDNDGEQAEDNNTNTNNNVGDSGTSESNDDLSAFADLLSEKDKRIDELEKSINDLKKSNAQLLVKVSAGATANTEKTYEENLLELVGAKPRKE